MIPPVTVCLEDVSDELRRFTFVIPMRLQMPAATFTGEAAAHRMARFGNAYMAGATGRPPPAQSLRATPGQIAALGDRAVWTQCMVPVGACRYVLTGAFILPTCPAGTYQGRRGQDMVYALCTSWKALASEGSA